MKNKFLITIPTLLILLLTACGAPATPTQPPVDVAGTAAALAWLSVTQTALAMPTATQVPPTSTPEPTVTPFPTVALVLPTVAPPTQPAATATNPCNDPPPIKPKGTVVSVQLKNETGGSVILSLGMNDPNTQGECGTYGFTLSRYDAPVVQVLAGCYWAYGWVTADKPSTTQTSSLLCLNDTTKTVAVTIGPETVGFAP